MAILRIPLNEGLVTSRDPSMLKPGELSKADGVEYHPNDQGAWKAAGRATATATAMSGDVKGLHYLEFDGAPDQLVAHVGGTYLSSTSGVGNLTFTERVTGLLGGDTLDSVHYNNVHYLLNGKDRNRTASIVSSTDAASVTTYTPTFGFHGMAANTTAPTYTNTGVGTGLTLASGKTLVYWVEERVKSGSTVLKRNAETGSTTVTVTGTGALIRPVITRPSPVNSDATHWALFSAATNDVFPTGAEIAEVVIATTTIEDTRTGTDPAIPGGSLYELLSVSIAGVTNNTARNGPPPIATTGDVFEDSICLNDVSDKTKLWYSWPDEPHEYPATNYVRFETKEADEITLIKQVSQGLIVCLRDAIWRIAYLPRPEDSQFDRGRVKTQVEGAHGCVGPKAGATFSFGQGQRLAYVSRYGLLITDGFVWDVLSGDLEWEEHFNVSKLSSAILTNNPRKFRLELRAPSKTSQANDVVYYFHYHPSHAKQGEAGLRCKVTGPMPLPASSATLMNFGGLHYVMTGGSNGKVYLEGYSVQDGDGNNLTMDLITGDIYPVSEGNAVRLEAVYLHHSQGGNSQSISGNLVQLSSGEEPFSRPYSASLASRNLTLISDQGEGEAFQLQATNADALGSFRLNYYVLDYDPSGFSKVS